MEQDEVCGRLKRAIQRLIERDLDLLVRDVNERSITHRLAMYLQEEFPEMDVDCEFNRDHDNAKKLAFYPKTARTNDTDAKTVFPDIIVHKRGPHGPNLLVIEAKKGGNPRRHNEDTDRQKLKAFKSDPLRYEHAVFLKLRTGNTNPGPGCIEFI